MGHVGRCAALAQAFAAAGASTVFWRAPESCKRWLEARGFSCTDARGGSWDLVVADSYRFTKADWAALRRSARSLLVIDDTGSFAGPCDWILNGHPYAAGLSFRAAGGAGVLLGAKFLPLRSEYWRRARPRVARRRVERVLVTLGGLDAAELSERAVDVVLAALPRARVDAVVSPLGKAPSLRPRLSLHRDPTSLRPLLEACDVVVCAGGQTLYEAAFTGAPALALELGPDQRGNLRSLAAAGTLVPLGVPRGAWRRTLARALRALDGARARRQAMADAGQALVDGGGARRVARLVLSEARA